MTDEKARISFTYQVSERGKYTLRIGYDALYGSKVVNVTVNGNTFPFQTGNNVMVEAEVDIFMITQGENTIMITPCWTWVRIDYIRLIQGGSMVEFGIADTPVDTHATDAVRTLYSFLYENFGKKTISGIMTGDMTTANGNVTQHADVQAVYKASGKYPALIGFDFMNAIGMNGNNSWNKIFHSRHYLESKSVSYACLNENYFIFLWYRKIVLWDTGIRLVIEKNNAIKVYWDNDIQDIDIHLRGISSVCFISSTGESYISTRLSVSRE